MVKLCYGQGRIKVLAGPGYFFSFLEQKNSTALFPSMGGFQHADTGKNKKSYRKFPLLEIKSERAKE